MAVSDERQAAAVAAAVERVLSDVAAGLGDDAIRIDVSPGTNPEIGISTTEINPGLTGLFLYPDESEAQLLARLADTVQECLAESMKHWGRAWPRCPDPLHEHPLTASPSAGGVWVCPATGEPVAAIGQLDVPDRRVWGTR